MINPSRVREIRECIFRMTQSEFGQLIAMSSMSVSRLERGKMDLTKTGFAKVALVAMEQAINKNGESKIRNFGWKERLTGSGVISCWAELFTMASS